MAFNLADYEEVQSKVQRWIDAYPLGRIETSIIEFNMEKGYVLVEEDAVNSAEISARRSNCD